MNRHTVTLAALGSQHEMDHTAVLLLHLWRLWRLWWTGRRRVCEREMDGSVEARVEMG